MNEINFSHLKRALTIKTRHAYYIGIIIRILCKDKNYKQQHWSATRLHYQPKMQSNSGHNVLKHEDSIVLQKAPRILK